MKFIKSSIEIGRRVRVRCICGQKDCLAPAREGGETGEVVNIERGLASVILDNHELVGALDFPVSALVREDC